MNVMEPPQTQNSRQTRLDGVRDSIKIKDNKIPGRNDAVSREKCTKITQMIEAKLYRIAKTEEEYSDLRTLGTRIDSLLKELQRVSLQHRVANNLTSVFKRITLQE